MMPERTSPLPGRGQRGPAGRGQQHVGERRRRGAATAVSGPFNRTTAPVAPARRRAAASRSVRRGGALMRGVLAVVGREDARGAPLVEQRARPRPSAERGQRVGVDHQRAPARPRRRPGSPPPRPSPVPSPGPTTTALHLAVASRNAPAHPSAGRCMRTASVGQAAGGIARASRAGSCRRRRPWRPGCTAWPRPPCPPSRRPRPTAVVHLLTWRGRGGQQRATSASSTSSACGAGNPIPMSATSTAPLQHRPVALQQAGLQRGERHGAVGPHGVARGLAGVGVDARGDVDGQHGRPGRRRGRVVGAAEPGAVGGVDHEVARGQRAPPRPRRPPARGTRAPRRARTAAATRPSAPLLPLPTTTTTRRP